MKKKLFTQFLIILSLTSCQDYISVKCNSYILGFYEYEEIGTLGSVVTVNGDKYARIDVYIPKARMVTDVFGNRPSDNGAYKSLCAKYNDTDYPERSFSSNQDRGEPDSCCYPDTDIESIIISRNGVDISSSAYYTSWSVFPYINNSYKKFHYTTAGLSAFFNEAYRMKEDEGETVRYPVDKQLSDLTEDDLLLPGNGFMCEPGGEGFRTSDILYPTLPEYGTEYKYNSENNLFTLFIPIDMNVSSMDIEVLITQTNGNTHSSSTVIDGYMDR